MIDFFFKNKKGDYEYAKEKKIKTFFLTALLYLLSCGLYFIGIKATGSNKNLLTIVAVLGLLPASKCFVSAIMNLRVRNADITLKEEIDKRIGSITGLYNMFFTSYSLCYYLDHMVITNNLLLGYVSDEAFDDKEFTTHLQKHMKLDNIDGVVIKIFKDKEHYLKRLDELNTSETNLTPNSQLYKLLLSISL